jgi:ADP-ribose pyrophosphatase
MKKTDSRTTHEGELVNVRVEEFRYEDGPTAEREVVVHPGAAAIVAYDDERLFMVRQPREPVGEESLLELPAGKLDQDETPLECAKRELVEEVGLEAAGWRELKRVYTSPGFTNEQVQIFAATDLTQVDPRPSEGERIEIVEVPLGKLDEAIDACADAKSLVGLLLLRAERDA